MEVLVEVGIFPKAVEGKSRKAEHKDEMRMELIRYPFNIMGQKEIAQLSRTSISYTI